jgi:2-methylisocitrate lyase-like PEP mutase family enzyme
MRWVHINNTTLFRSYLVAPGATIIPGVADPLTAKIAERAGFKAVFLSGYAASAVRLGAPDVGLLTLTEMVDCAARIADAVDVPLFADGDNGHGNATNVIRSMKQFEKAGVAAIFFEDQVTPKRCGHMSGKQVIPKVEMIAKIRAAVDTRADRDLVIMARTDALSVNGIDDAIDRMHSYIEAGADMSFVESPRSIDEMRRITSEIAAPNMANLVQGGKSPVLPLATLEEIGFKVVAYPTLALYAMAKATHTALEHLQAKGTSEGLEAGIFDFEGFNKLTGLDAVRAKEAELYG